MTPGYLCDISPCILIFCVDQCVERFALDFLQFLLLADDPFKTFEDLGVSKQQLNNVEIEIVPRSTWSDWGTLAITILPLVILGGLLFFMLRQAQGSKTKT